MKRLPMEYGGAGARLTVAASMVILFMGSTIVSPIYALYQRRFAFSELTLTLIFAAYVVGNLAALLLLGRLSDEIGRRRVILPAIALASVSTVFYLFAADTGMIFVARILSGFAIGLSSGTNTAWLAELTPGRDKSGPSVTAASSTMLGLAVAPLIAGTLAQYAPQPLHLSFVVYLALLFAVAFFVMRTRETVAEPVRTFGALSLKPRIGVPPEIRAAFLAPALTGFAIISLCGFYAGLVPNILIDDLHRSNLAIGGDIVFGLFFTAAVAIVLTRRVGSRTAMLGGLVFLIAGLALLMFAQKARSMPILQAATVVSGIALALGYRGSLQVVNQIAPDAKRAEVVSSYMAMCYLGNTVPVFGVGIVARMSDLDTAYIAFAVIIALLAVAALATEMRALRPT